MEYKKWIEVPSRLPTPKKGQHNKSVALKLGEQAWGFQSFPSGESVELLPGVWSYHGVYSSGLVMNLYKYPQFQLYWYPLEADKTGMVNMSNNHFGLFGAGRSLPVVSYLLFDRLYRSKAGSKKQKYANAPTIGMDFLGDYDEYVAYMEEYWESELKQNHPLVYDFYMSHKSDWEEYLVPKQ